MFERHQGSVYCLLYRIKESVIRENGENEAIIIVKLLNVKINLQYMSVYIH